AERDQPHDVQHAARGIAAALLRDDDLAADPLVRVVAVPLDQRVQVRKVQGQRLQAREVDDDLLMVAVVAAQHLARDVLDHDGGPQVLEVARLQEPAGAEVASVQLHGVTRPISLMPIGVVSRYFLIACSNACNLANIFGVSSTRSSSSPYWSW